VIHGIVAGSNPDGVARTLLNWPLDWPRPALLDDVADCPLDIRLEEPNKAGVDRILNAVACNFIRPYGQPALIIDSGTATTVDALSADGAFEGGAIHPGFELCARALHQYTALLPLITIDELIDESHEPLGRNTREALRGGLVWGQVGAIKELAAQLSRRWNAPPFVLLTGGGAPLASSYLPEAQWEPHLSLQGLAIVGERLRDRAS
jgi:type III pantothenate kinase